MLSLDVSEWCVCVPHAGLPTSPGSALVSGLATVGIGCSLSMNGEMKSMSEIDEFSSVYCFHTTA